MYIFRLQGSEIEVVVRNSTLLDGTICHGQFAKPIPNHQASFMPKSINCRSLQVDNDFIFSRRKYLVFIEHVHVAQGTVRGLLFLILFFFSYFFLKQPYDAIFSLFFDDARSTEFFKCTKGAADFGPDKRIFFFILFESMSMMMVVGPPG